MSKIWDEINDMIGERYETEEGWIRPYDNDGLHITYAISEILQAYGVQYTVEQEDCFESPAYDTGAVFAAWIENGKLNSISYQYELR